MKKSSLFRSYLLAILIAALLPLSGCSDNSASQYVGDQITSMKESDTSYFTDLLKEGISEANSDENYVLQFPEELKEPYLEFLQNAFKTIQFDVSNAKKLDNGNYTVQLTYTPLNIKDTLNTANTELLASLESTDLTEAAASILGEAAGVLEDSPVFQEETVSTLELEKDGDAYSITPESMDTFLSYALPGYMEPFTMVRDVLDARDYLQAYLDAAFKGDITRFALHTDYTEEEALAWYEDGLEPPSDLSSAYVQRYKDALRTIMAGCQYTIHIPVKENGIYNYTVDVTTVPNTSFENAYNEFEQGTYASIDAASAGLVEAMEKYAAAPTCGEETTITVTLSLSSLMNAGNDGSDLTYLAQTILVMP